MATQNPNATQVSAMAQALIPVAHGLIEQVNNSVVGTSKGGGEAEDVNDAAKKGKKADKVRCYRCGRSEERRVGKECLL